MRGGGDSSGGKLSASQPEDPGSNPSWGLTRVTLKRGEEITSCKIHTAPVSFTDGRIMTLKKNFKKKHFYLKVGYIKQKISHSTPKIKQKISHSTPKVKEYCQTEKIYFSVPKVKVLSNRRFLYLKSKYCQTEY